MEIKKVDDERLHYIYQHIMIEMVDCLSNAPLQIVEIAAELLKQLLSKVYDGIEEQGPLLLLAVPLPLT